MVSIKREDEERKFEYRILEEISSTGGWKEESWRTKKDNLSVE